MRSDSAAAREWRDNWTLVIATFVGISFLTLTTNSLNMFIEPVGAEFGWSRAFISLGFTISALITMVLAPFMGLAVDRWGSRRVGLPGILATILTICAFSLATGSHVQWLAIWVIYAFISITVKTTVWTAPIARTFSAARGLALGITLCGAAASQAILPPLTNWLIDTQGWRMAYVWLSVGWGGMTFVLCWLFLYDAHDRLPAGEQAAARRDGPVLPGLTITGAWRDRGLWQIAVSTMLILLFAMGLTVHQIAILGEAGVSRTNAAWLASMAGVAGIVGKLATGMLLDRFRPNWVGGITMSAAALGFALVIDGIHSPPLIFFAMLVNGYTLGTKLQITSYLTSRYAGMRNFGAIFGFMVSVTSLGGALGPLLAGMSYDNLGGYEAFLIAGTIGCVISGLLIFSLPPVPNWEGQGEKVREDPESLVAPLETPAR